MFRKFFALLTVIAIATMSMSMGGSGVSQAQSVSSNTKIFLPMVGASSDTSKAPSVDNLPVPDAVKAAVALRTSLSAEQLASLGPMVERYNSRISAITQNLPRIADLEAASVAKPSSKTPDASTLTAPSTAQSALVAQNTQAVQAQMAAINSDMEKDFTSILNPTQLALFQASKIAANQANAKQNSAMAGTLDASVQASTTCYTAASYMGAGAYNLYWGYYYGYYNYAYYGTTYGYYAYLYSYYAYFSYAFSAVPQLGGAYFGILATGYDYQGIGDDGTTNAYNAYYYGYYAAYYASLDYSAYGRSLAYSSYYYSYYGYNQAYNAYYYGYYYCQ